MGLRDTLLDDNQDLRRCIQDLVDLSALPAVWTGYNAQRIAESLADVLLDMLCLDFAYIRVKRQAPDMFLEVVRTEEGMNGAGQAHMLGKVLAPWRDVKEGGSPVPYIILWDTALCKSSRPHLGLALNMAS